MYLTYSVLRRMSCIAPHWASDWRLPSLYQTLHMTAGMRQRSAPIRMNVLIVVAISRSLPHFGLAAASCSFAFLDVSLAQGSGSGLDPVACSDPPPRREKRTRRIADVLPLRRRRDHRSMGHGEARSVLGSWAQGQRDDQSRNMDRPVQKRIKY